ncbi:Hypothetical predicted protein [Mytilus galloprovincialis]|uniref:G-protein coupled receptors family 1 profile domain-containing protein n=1 Tax=Mytilus galloprovincialis TaxID=29158 RepID=A0A8B6GXR4_MYTGA|nr:Hypothetical predicted protein [Mytilus galloprovincialis]
MANVTVGATLLLESITTNASTVVNDVDTSVYYDVEKYSWIIFSPLFLMIGFVGNLLNICVLFRLKFYKNATYTLLFILAFTDLTVLFTGLTRYLIIYASDVDIRVLSEFSCRFSLFLIYFSMQFSSWILVLVTVIRFMKTFVPLRRTASKDITIKNTLVSLLIAAIMLIGINLHFFWTNGITDEGDCSSLTPEYYEFDEKVFVYVDFVFLSILPAGIMIVLNALICYELSKLTKTRRRMSIQSGVSPLRRQKSTKRVTWMLLVTTSYFIVATIPISIYFIVDSHVRPGADASTESRLDIAWTITYLFQYSHFALNFYLYTATNEKFRKELTALTKNVYQRISTSSNQPIKPAPSREYSSDSKKISATQST